MKKLLFLLLLAYNNLFFCMDTGYTVDLNSTENKSQRLKKIAFQSDKRNKCFEFCFVTCLIAGYSFFIVRPLLKPFFNE